MAVSMLPWPVIITASVSGAIDFIPGGVGSDAALQVQERWAGTGNARIAE